MSHSLKAGNAVAPDSRDILSYHIALSYFPLARFFHLRTKFPEPTSANNPAPVAQTTYRLCVSCHDSVINTY